MTLATHTLPQRQVTRPQSSVSPLSLTANPNSLVWADRLTHYLPVLLLGIPLLLNLVIIVGITPSAQSSPDPVATSR